MNLKVNNLKAIISKEKKVTKVAEEMGVTRQIVHKWLNRYKRFGIDGLIAQRRNYSCVAHNRTSPEVEQLVINVAHEYFADGVETLHDRFYTLVSNEKP